MLLSFIKDNTNLLLFGLMLTFFSSFGQTFLIALYVPAISQKFGFSNAAFGSIYGVVTLASALTLTYAGKLIDRFSLKQYTLASVFVLAFALMITALSVHPIMLVIGLWGLRLAGQGLMPHIALTSMSRFFSVTRGKAISISTLGHPLGEAVLPIAITLMITTMGWRETMLISAGLILMVFVPLVQRGVDYEKQYTVKGHTTKDAISWRQRDVLKSPQFYKILPGVFLLPLLTTGLFFYQLTLANFQNWKPEWLATCFLGYAIANSSCMLWAGSLVDKFTARRLFPYYLVPFILSLTFLYFFSHPVIAVIYMVLMGIAVGFGSTIRSSLLAEMFGIQSIGAVRSLFTTMTVVATAVGPALFGLILDKGYAFDVIILGSIIAMIAVTLQSFRVLPAFRRKRFYVKLRMRNPFSQLHKNYESV